MLHVTQTLHRLLLDQWSIRYESLHEPLSDYRNSLYNICFYKIISTCLWFFPDPNMAPRNPEQEKEILQVLSISALWSWHIDLLIFSGLRRCWMRSFPRVTLLMFCRTEWSSADWWTKSSRRVSRRSRKRYIQVIKGWWLIKWRDLILI